MLRHLSLRWRNSDLSAVPYDGGYGLASTAGKTLDASVEGRIQTRTDAHLERVRLGHLRHGIHAADRSIRPVRYHWSRRERPRAAGLRAQRGRHGLYRTQLHGDEQ